MNPIKNLKIVFKQLLIIGNIIFFMLLLAFISTSGFNSQKKTLSILIDDRFELYKIINGTLAELFIIDSDFELFITKHLNSEILPLYEGNMVISKVTSTIKQQVEILNAALNHGEILGQEKEVIEKGIIQINEYNDSIVRAVKFGFVNTLMLKNIRQQIKSDSEKMRNNIMSLKTFEENQMSLLKNSAIKELDMQILYFWIICGFTIAISLVISLLISRMIITPIRNIVDYSQYIASGNLTHILNIDSTDEMGSLSGYFETVVNNFKEIIINLKNIQGQNLDIKDQLIANTTETFASITEISSNLNSSLNMLNSLGGTVTVSVNTSDEISKLINNYSQQIKDQNESILRSSKCVDDIVKSITEISAISSERSKKSQELLSITETGFNKMDETNIKIKEMSAITDTMLDAIDIIRDITERTNLLSINSAIEAAHAGEAGKSFSVVADEIRKLAESSSFSSKIISTNLNKNVEMIKNLLGISEESSAFFKLIGEEVKQVVKTLNDISSSLQNLAFSGQDILSIIGKLLSITEQVQSSSGSIEIGIHSIKATILQVNNISTQVINAISEISIGANQINSAMTTLNQNAVRMEEGVMEVSKTVERFITE